MIELSILDLLFLVLTFFTVIIGTLLTVVLLRVLKILRVGVELANYYKMVKQFIISYAMIPYVIKDRIFEKFTNNSESSEQEKLQDPIL